jgi:hypothetical protein
MTHLDPDEIDGVLDTLSELLEMHFMVSDKCFEKCQQYRRLRDNIERGTDEYEAIQGNIDQEQKKRKEATRIFYNIKALHDALREYKEQIKCDPKMYSRDN